MIDPSRENSSSKSTYQADFYQAWIHILEKLSHDLIGSMAIIRQKNTILSRMLPSLLKGYQLAVENKLMDAVVKERHLSLIGDLDPEVHIVDMIGQIHSINAYAEQISPDSPDIKTLSAMVCLNEVLENYLFESEAQRSLVHIDSDGDFQFKCSFIFINSLLNNLMANALRSIKRSGKGAISISLSQAGNYNTLHFNDTGSGMSNDQCACIFDRFISKREGKTLPGLGFCRMAIQYVGGDVVCDTVEGESTHYTVKFPIDSRS